MHLSKYITDISKSALKKRGFADNKIFDEWMNIVGDNYKDICKPIKLSNTQQNEGGLLTIEVKSALSTEMNMQRLQLIEKINNYFGYNAISAIKINIVL